MNEPVFEPETQRKRVFLHFNCALQCVVHALNAERTNQPTNETNETKQTIQRLSHK